MSSLASTAAQGVAFWMDQNEAEQLESRVPAVRRCEGWSTNLFHLTAYEHLWTRSTLDRRCGFSCQFHQNASIFSLSSWRSKQLLQSSIATVFCFIFSAYHACANYQSQDKRSRKTIRTLPTQIARLLGALAVHNLRRLYPESHPSRPPAGHAQKQVAGPRFQLGETTMTKCGNWTDRAWDCLMHAVLRVSFYTLPVQENIRSILESMARKKIRWLRARTLSPLSPFVVCLLIWSHLSFSDPAESPPKPLMVAVAPPISWSVQQAAHRCLPPKLQQSQTVENTWSSCLYAICFFEVNKNDLICT